MKVLFISLVTCALLQGSLLAAQPNIVLMMADDLGWGDPSYNGGWIHTPTLDSMAASGVRFDRFYSAGSVCSPTRASCLTGRNPFRVGVPTANSGHLGRDETPLSEVLDDAGYTCGHFGKWHLGTLTTLTEDSNRGRPGADSHYSPPWHHQYDTCFATEAKVPTYHPMRKTGSNATPEPLSFADDNFYGTRYWTPPLDPATWTNATGEGAAVAVTDNLSGDDSTVVMDRVIPFIQGAVSSNQPFFAVVWFHTPHKPLVDPQLTSDVDSEDAYTDAIQNMDAQIGRLREELDTLGVRTNTMLWFCSDNGPENGVGQTGGLRERKRSLFEGGVRVPGLLEWPAVVTAARTTDYPCVTSDYYPTILDALHLSVTNQKPIDGISLMPLLANPDTELTRTNAIGFLFDDDRSWVTQQYKLISLDDGSSYKLFDLLSDTNEAYNIAGSYPDIRDRLILELETWMAAVGDDAEYVPPLSVTNRVTTLTSPVYQTVDSNGGIPGDGDNNIDKFDTGGSYPAEFTTTLYVRANGTRTDARVRAYAKFNLSSVTDEVVMGATLRFRGFALNDVVEQNTSIVVERLLEDWTRASTPYAPARTDTVIGSTVRKVGAPSIGKDFHVDVTGIVTQWLNGGTNHGFFLRLESMQVSNGLGIKTSGDGEIELQIRQLPADADGDGMPDEWEREHFGSTTNSAGGSLEDWDEDGFVDLHEFLAGTIPTNPVSRLVLTGVSPAGTNQVAINWQAVTGKQYDILRATSLWNSVWTTQETGISGVSPQCVHTVTVERPAGYFRVELNEADALLKE